MRGSAWLLGLSLLAATSSASAAPKRVASLNLCTDELLLLLGEPAQIVSVTHLAHQRAETLHWQQGRRHRANDGSLVSVAPLKPDLVLTMGGGARDRIAIARRIGVEVLDLPYPRSIQDVEASIGRVSRALGQEARGRAVLAKMAGLKRSASSRRTDAIWLGGGGRTVAPHGLEAQWMRLAGLRQRQTQGDRVSLEHLLVAPPAVLLRSDYRKGQYSGQQRWLAHPLARRTKAGRTLPTDGRRWTCMGPSLIPEVLRLRQALAR